MFAGLGCLALLFLPTLFGRVTTQPAPYAYAPRDVGGFPPTPFMGFMQPTRHYTGHQPGPRHGVGRGGFQSPGAGTFFATSTPLPRTGTIGHQPGPRHEVGSDRQPPRSGPTGHQVGQRHAVGSNHQPPFTGPRHMPPPSQPPTPGSSGHQSGQRHQVGPK